MLRFFFDPRFWLQRDCALTMDYSLGSNCFNSKGGVSRIYIAEYDTMKGVIHANGTVSAITNAPAKRWFQYQLTRSTAEASSELQVNQETNSQHSAESLKFVINTMSAAMTMELTALAGNVVRVIVVDRNGSGWLYGLNYGMTVKSIKASPGKAGGDRNGYELELEGDEDYLPLYVPSSLFAGLLTAGV